MQKYADRFYRVPEDQMFPKVTEEDRRWQRIEAAAVAIAGGVSARGLSGDAVKQFQYHVVNVAEGLIDEIDRRRAESK